MWRETWNRKVWTLLIAEGLLLFALSGCGAAGQEVLPGAPQVESPKPEMSEPAALPETAEPAVTSEPAETTVTPEPTGPEAIPEPVEAGTTPEPSEPVAAPEPSEPVVTAEPAVSESQAPPAETPAVPEEMVADTDEVDADLEDESVALSSAPAAVSHAVSAVASGVLEKKNDDAVIDYSNTADGYVMVCYTGQIESRLKVQVKGPSTTYTYNLMPGEWAVFPLSDGNGAYQVAVYRNIADNKYAAVLSMKTEVELKDEFAPFLHSNQYVDYDHAPKTVAMAAHLIGAVEDPLKQVEIVYDYVVKGMSYDKALASTVKSGYLPVLDAVLEKKTGICFDYAALMTGMLRSQGVPCKLVVGYAGSAYHAWISVWVEGSGWVDGVIWFNGAGWQRMDPTFASSADSSESILAYIGDGTNYTAKYFY